MTNTIQRVSTKEEFKGFLTKGEPVIITGIVEQWPAYRQYSMEFFCANMGGIELPCRVGQERKRLTFQQLFDQLKKEDSGDCYAPQLPLFNHNNIGKSEDLYSSMCPPLDWLEHFNEANIWVGRGITPLHYDGYDNLLAVMEGEKQLMLFPPEAMLSAKIKGQWSQINAQELLKSFPTHFEINLKPGELLYIPPYWLHEVTVPTSNAISINYWYQQGNGEALSKFAAYVGQSFEQMSYMAAELNDAEKGQFIRVLEAGIKQFKEGTFPPSQSELTWSHEIQNNSFSLPNL